MPSGPRIRDNGILGTTTDNPLTAGAGTFNSAGLANLEIVAAAHATVTLDPLREFGEPEIVIITAHTAAATVATITRAAYGTVARSHPLGTLWVHAAVDEDFIEILTSGTRPADPFEGQFIYETDTNKLVGYGGTDWAPRDAGGQLGYAEAVANQAGITTIVDLTSLSVAVTVGTGRRVKLTGFLPSVACTAADNTMQLKIQEGATVLVSVDHGNPTANTGDFMRAERILSPSAGAHTYKLTLARVVGAGSLNVNASATSPAFVLVEDIGAA